MTIRTIDTAKERSLTAFGMTLSAGSEKPCHPEPKARDLARAAADALCLAATPTFALMALLTGLAGGGAQDMLCGQMASPIGGMVPMYLLMSAFHATPWLRRIFRNERSDTP